MLRIIAGKYKNRKIALPPANITRPTKEKVREAIFSSLYTRVEQAIVLDLFAGSGIFAFEAVSRGALKAIAVDNNKIAIKKIRDNIVNLKINNIDFFQIDAIKFLIRKKNIKFDIIFCDPPYNNQKILLQILKIVVDNKLLKEQGQLILECDNYLENNLYSEDMIMRRKKYGRTNLYFFSKIL